jgi:hypothetical protein
VWPEPLVDPEIMFSLNKDARRWTTFTWWPLLKTPTRAHLSSFLLSFSSLLSSSVSTVTWASDIMIIMIIIHHHHHRDVRQGRSTNLPPIVTSARSVLPHRRHAARHQLLGWSVQEY